MKQRTNEVARESRSLIWKSLAVPRLRGRCTYESVTHASTASVVDDSVIGLGV